jgi:glycosyltransferase involved in cell wall biosynthesis
MEKNSGQQGLSFSIIVPVYNRPSEIDELLDSLTKQTNRNFEVIIIEDGSYVKCDWVIEKYTTLLDVNYFYKNNSGPGLSRNYGYEKAKGNYCIFLDSDIILPPQYFEVVESELAKGFIDAFGGPEKVHEKFTALQKAINYAMTSIITTGGIRGGKENFDKFYPRSFNMGYSREVFFKTGGFSSMRFGEDIDMSIRIIANGFKTKLIKDAYVYHIRRATIKQFFKQIFNSGIARINLYIKYPASLKLVYIFPSIFLIGLMGLIILSIFASELFLVPILVLMALLMIDSTVRNKSISIGFLSIVTSFIQLTAYGAGFILAFWKRIVFNGSEFAAFTKKFYK